MNRNKIMIYIAVLLFWTCSLSSAATVSARAAEISPGRAQAGIGLKAARAENADRREYTPEELCCMAQYYYKRTSEDGYYPPKASSKNLENDLYEIVLFEEVKEPDGTVHSTTYARYSLGKDAKGTDTVLGKEIDLTLYSRVYTPEELCKLAQHYFFSVHDFYTPNESYRDTKGGSYTICLFETIDDEGGTSHNATCGWYTVNVCGVGTDDLMMQPIDING